MSTAIRGSADAEAEFPSQPWENHTARFTAHRGPSAAVVTAHGELDASNAAALVDFVQRSATHSAQLVLDLSELEFFGTSGFSALHAINVRCAGAGVGWAVVPSEAVSRLLRICDPDQTLPITGSPATGAEPHRLLELIPQSG